MSTEAERALWDAAAALLETNRSFIPKDASPASVGVMKPPPEGAIIPPGVLDKENEAA